MMPSHGAKENIYKYLLLIHLGERNLLELNFVKNILK